MDSRWVYALSYYCSAAAVSLSKDENEGSQENQGNYTEPICSLLQIVSDKSASGVEISFIDIL